MKTDRQIKIVKQHTITTMRKISKLKIILFGAIIGLVNGFFGGGGGMIVVPMLTKMFNMEQKKAQATALFVILPISLLSTIVYMCYNSIDFATGWPVIVGIVAGGALGAGLLNKLRNDVVKGVFIFFMILGGAVMLFK
ncbi:MAG: sulfite exporter TauE/SafE family protein [Clostridia bacterium]|nr:sulfite exporter TauE/SafE family protein [Clostridia bacterium]